jgi:hypothetical protein
MEKTVGLGNRMDLIFHNIRLGLFFMDHGKYLFWLCLIPGKGYSAVSQQFKHFLLVMASA